MELTIDASAPAARWRLHNVQVWNTLVLAIAADDQVESVRVRQIVWTPLGYAASLAVILLGYYELHAVLFGTTLT